MKKYEVLQPATTLIAKMSFVAICKETQTKSQHYLTAGYAIGELAELMGLKIDENSCVNALLDEDNRYHGKHLHFEIVKYEGYKKLFHYTIQLSFIDGVYFVSPIYHDKRNGERVLYKPLKYTCTKEHSLELWQQWQSDYATYKATGEIASWNE